MTPFSPITPANYALNQNSYYMPQVDSRTGYMPLSGADQMFGSLPLSPVDQLLSKNITMGGSNIKSNTSFSSLEAYEANIKKAAENKQLKLIEEMNASGLNLTNEEMEHLKSATSKMVYAQGNQGSALGEGAAYLTMGVVGQLGLNPVLNTQLAVKGHHISMFKDLKIEKSLRTKEVETAINNAKSAIRQAELRSRLKDSGDAFKGKIDPKKTFPRMKNHMARALEALKNAKTPEEVAAATKKLNVVTQSINETISNNCGYVKRTWKKYVHKQKVKAPTASGFDKTIQEVTKQTEQAAQQAAQKTAQQAAQQAAQQTASTAAKVSSKVVGGLKIAARGAGKFLKNGALIIGFEVLSDKDKLARAYSKDKKTGRRQAVQTGTKAVCATAGYLAGMKAGAALGATIGSAFPGIGNAVGFVAGALIGGVCAFLGRKLGKRLGGKMVGAPKGKDVADTITEEQVATHSGKYTTNENGENVAIASQEQLTVVNEVITWASQVQGTKENTLTEEELAVLNKLAATMQPAETTQAA